jgi:hypothetical protein
MSSSSLREMIAAGIPAPAEDPKNAQPTRQLARIAVSPNASNS